MSNPNGHLTHGHSTGGKQTSTYKSWAGMMSRCYSPNTTRYAEWGGRGIRVFDSWHKFENFLADMGEKPEGKSIDRYPDNDGNYEPGNVRWASDKEQCENRRPHRKQYLCVCQICGTEFMAVMSRAKNCSTECRNEASLQRYYKLKEDKK